MPINSQATAAQYQRGLNYPTRLSRTDSKVVDTALVTVNMQVVADDTARFATGLQAGGLVYQVNNSTFYEFSGIFSGVDNLSVAGDWAAVEFGSLEWQSSAITYLLTPPGSPIDGDRYLIGTLATDVGTGDWTNHQTEIAQYNGNTASWDFTVPVVGATISIDDQPQAFYQFGGTDWVAKNFEQTTVSGILTKTGFNITVTTDSIVDSYVNTAAGIASSKSAHTQGTPGDWTAADASTVAVHLDEVGSRLSDTESATGINTAHRGVSTGNPHSVTATEVGLGNVTNVGTSNNPYNEGAWNNVTDAPTKNVVRDKFEADKLLIDANTTNNVGVVTVHSDVADAGSGIIISDTERTQIGTNQTNIGTNVTAIGLNTAKVSADGLVTTHTDITSAGSGAIITATERSAITNNSNANSGSVTVHSDVDEAGSGQIITTVERTGISQDRNARLIEGGNLSVAIGALATDNSAVNASFWTNFNSVGDGGAVKFTATGTSLNSFTSNSWGNQGATTFTLTGYLFSDSGGVPDTLLYTSDNTVNEGDVDVYVDSSTIYTDITMNFTGATIIPGTVYHAVWNLTAHTGGSLRQSITNSGEPGGQAWTYIADGTGPSGTYQTDAGTKSSNLRTSQVGGPELTWDASLFVQIPGQANARNEISAATVALYDGDCAHVTINREAGAGDTLTVNTTAIASIDETAPDLFIIARGTSDGIVVNRQEVLTVGNTGASFRGWTVSAAAASTAELPDDHNWGIHEDTGGGTISLVVNDGGVIKTVALT